MSNQDISHKVPLGQKIAFGLGMLANQMFPAALGIFMVVLVENLGMPSWMWGVLFFVPRIVDAFFDPIMGFISDNTKSVWGRRRQYVFVGSIIMGVAFMLMWQLHREDSVMYNFTFFLTFSLIFHIGLSIFSVPYVAMGYEMSDDFHERTSIMAISQWIGQFAWVIAPWFWVIMYDPSWFPNADTATRTLAVWVGSVFMLLAMVPAIFIKSKSTKFDDTLQPLTYKTIGGSLTEILISFKEAFSNKPFRKLCIATFFIFNAFNTVAGFTFFIVVYYLFNGNTAAAGIWPTLFGCGGALATTFIVIPIVAWIAKKMEKKRAFLICQGISIFGYILLWFLFIPGKPYMFLFALPFFSFGIGSLFTLMMSMTADVCDMDELESGKRREGVFGAIYWWMVKFGFAIAGLLTGVIMSAVAFKAGAPTQPEGAVTGLRLFFSGVPILGTLIAMWVMWNYDLTEKKAREIKKQLDARKGKANTASSAYVSGKLNTLLHNSNLNKIIGTDYSKKTKAEIEILFSEQFNSGVNGLCFSAYTEGQIVGDILSEEQIVRRLDIVAPHTKCIRTFSCTEGNELIPEIAHQKGIKSMVGAWISNDKDRNEKEINALIKLANAGLVDIAAVGNEVLLREELSEEELIEYIKRVKAAIPSHIEVGYVDAYYQFIERPKLIDSCDLLLCNFYPFWEGVSIDYSMSYLNSMFEVTKGASKGKRIIITETGWPSVGEIVEDAVPSEINAMKYFIVAQEWASQNKIETFHFSSFDESWKVMQEGKVGTSWGLWDKNEKFKYKK
jgi:GPH family glycoside/pentoside/hexuronide:cation symporter